MSKPIIEVKGLSKVYQLGTIGATSLKLEVERLWHSIRGKNGSARKSGEFWALRDVSFAVEPGKVVGIIGRNGAGKSTLLKILSRITQQTAGEIVLRGRVASLLEVGTGFHPDLSGRENIYLNGAILGMTKTEIRSKLDEIVAFAEIEQFVDTPVKRYSSGMYVRLAFAVAAHLEPEILIVDEVLAVGDAAFQKKCLGKMHDVASRGRTVLFVSHNMAAIQSLCDSGIMLRNGSVLKYGLVNEVVSSYLSEGTTTVDGQIELTTHPARARNGGTPWLTRLTLRDEHGVPTSRFASSRPISAEIEITPPREIINPRLAIAIEDEHGRRIGTTASHFDVSHTGRFGEPFTATAFLPRLNLGPGRYLLSVSIGEIGGQLDSIDGASWFEVEWDNAYRTGALHEWFYGPVVMAGEWRVACSPKIN